MWLPSWDSWYLQIIVLMLLLRCSNQHIYTMLGPYKVHPNRERGFRFHHLLPSVRELMEHISLDEEIYIWIARAEYAEFVSAAAQAKSKRSVHILYL